MAKRARKTSVFLILSRNDERKKLTSLLQVAGYIVEDYTTAREFLIDKRNHISGAVVMDYRLPDMMGVELCEQLTTERSQFPVVIVSGPADVPKVLAVGEELVIRPLSIESLEAAISRAVNGENFTEKELERAFVKLTAREREVVEMVVDGKSSREISELLGLSAKTVEAHRARIMAKTRADDVGHLARLWRARNQYG